MSSNCPKCGASGRRFHEFRAATSGIGCDNPPNATWWDCHSHQVDGEEFVQSWECRARVAEKEIERLRAILSKIDSSPVAAAELIVDTELKGTTDGIR